MLGRYWLRGRRRQAVDGYVRLAAVKMIATTLGVAFLLMHVRFRYVRTVLYALLIADVVLVSYHVFLQVKLSV